MKIEKLNENKIKICFNSKDLEDNHISIHSFMSNSIESQNIFLNFLKIAEKEVGFITKDYTITIEALTQNNDNFTLIVSRFSDKVISKSRCRLQTSRKLSSIENTISLYRFETIEAFLDFSNYLLENFSDLSDILYGNNSLYEVNNSYFLSINRIDLNKKLLFKITSIFAEFCEFINISSFTFQKLKECGNLLIENFALQMVVEQDKQI